MKQIKNLINVEALIIALALLSVAGLVLCTFIATVKPFSIETNQLIIFVTGCLLPFFIGGAFILADLD